MKYDKKFKTIRKRIFCLLFMLLSKALVLRFVIVACSISEIIRSTFKQFIFIVIVFGNWAVISNSENAVFHRIQSNSA